MSAPVQQTGGVPKSELPRAHTRRTLVVNCRISSRFCLKVTFYSVCLYMKQGRFDIVDCQYVHTPAMNQ